MTEEPLKDVFKRFVAACVEGDDLEAEACKKLLLRAGQSIKVETSDELEWEDCASSGYEECPLVTQIFKVYHGDELIYEGQRLFGSEPVDPTHTGLGGRWQTIQVDIGDENRTIDALEDLGLEVEWPAVPEWR